MRPVESCLVRSRLMRSRAPQPFANPAKYRACSVAAPSSSTSTHQAPSRQGQQQGMPALLELLEGSSSLRDHLRQAMMAIGAASMAITLSASCVLDSSAAVPPGKAEVSGQELLAIIKEDFLKRKYLVTGDLTKEVYSDHCHFADSRDDFGDIGLQNWSNAVKLLFDGEASKLALTNDVVLDEAGRTVTFTGWRQVDVFRLPGAPHTPVFTGHTVLKLDPVANIVIDHTETWDQKPDQVSGAIKFFDYGFNPPGFD